MKFFTMYCLPLINDIVMTQDIGHLSSVIRQSTYYTFISLLFESFHPLTVVATNIGMLVEIIKKHIFCI